MTLNTILDVDNCDLTVWSLLWLCLLSFIFFIIFFVFYLFAGKLHEDVTHDALPLALEHAILEGMKEVKVLLDEKPQRAGKRTADGNTRGESKDK